MCRPSVCVVVELMMRIVSRDERKARLRSGKMTYHIGSNERAAALDIDTTAANPAGARLTPMLPLSLDVGTQ